MKRLCSTLENRLLMPGYQPQPIGLWHKCTAVAADTKQVTGEQGGHFLQKQQDHSMSQLVIYNLQTSSLICSEMVEEERMVGEPGEQHVTGGRQWWAVRRCFLCRSEPVGRRGVYSLLPTDTHSHTHAKMGGGHETSLKRSFADHVSITLCSCHVILSVSL